MTFVTHMLADTPLYVFVLFAYLVWQGALSLRTRQRAVWRMLIVPGLFTTTGLLLLVLRPGGTLPTVAWFVGLAAFIRLGLVTGPRLLTVERGRGRVTLAGSPVSLVRNLLIFGAQYGIAVALFLHPETKAILASAGHSVAGASVGYFIGWTIAFRSRYRAAAVAAIDESHATSRRA
jgi:hypothetical protein